MSKNYSKPKTWLVILITTLCVIAVIGITWLIMAFASPYTLGNMAYKAGFDRYAHTLYMRDYKKSGNVNSLYKSLNLSIKLNSFGNIIVEYEDFESKSNYSEMIEKINNDNMNLNLDNLTKSTLVSEDEYLKNCYVFALIGTGKWEDAMQIAFDNLDGCTPTLDNLGNYLYGNLVKNMGDKSAQFSGTTHDLIANYLTNLETVLDNNFDVNKEVKCYALCNKIIKVGANLISINNALDLSSENASVQTIINKATSALSTLMGD